MKIFNGPRTVPFCMPVLLSLLLTLGAASRQVAGQDGDTTILTSWTRYNAECSDDGPGWWDSVCNHCRAWRRHLRRSHQEMQRHLYHPKYEPHFSSTFGYYQTQWGTFPCDYGFATTGSIVVPPPEAPATDSTPASVPDGSVPMVPGAEDPSDSYFPPPVSPPMPEESETPAEPGGDEADPAPPSLNLIPMDGRPEVQELFTPIAPDELPRIRPIEPQQRLDQSIEQAWCPSQKREVPLPPQVVLEQQEAPVVQIFER